MVVESVLAKLTAGAAFRFESVVFVLGSALADVVIFGVSERSRPLTVVARVLTWLGVDWGAPLAHLHVWLADRASVIVPAMLFVGVLALLAAIAAAELVVASTPLVDPRWVVAVTFCAAVWTEIDGPGVLWWVVAAIVAAAVTAAVRTGDYSLLGLAVMPVFLVMLPLIMLFAFLLPHHD